MKTQTQGLNIKRIMQNCEDSFDCTSSKGNNNICSKKNLEIELSPSSGANLADSVGADKLMNVKVP